MQESFATGEPRTGPEILAALSALQVESESFFGTLSTPMFLAPQGDRWSPADHLRHLTKSVRPVAQGLHLPRIVLRLRFGAPSATARSFAELRDFYRQRLAEGVQAGRFAPRPLSEAPEPESFRREVLERWRAANRDLASAASRWSEKGLDRTAVPHPALGKLSVREMLFFTLYHNAHHARLVAERLPARADSALEQRVALRPPASDPSRARGREPGGSAPDSRSPPRPPPRRDPRRGRSAGWDWPRSRRVGRRR